MLKKNSGEEKKQLKMAELSAGSGFSISTIYDYLRSGLLQPPFKDSPTKSYFSQVHLGRLKEIRSLRDNGMSLAEIKTHFGCDENDLKKESGTSETVRLEIIDKALELFSRYHYENTKISDITNALNMGNGTFYRYFNSKEELFLDCLERLPKFLVPRDAWAEVEKETDYIQRLRKRGYAMLNAFPSYIGILNYAKLALGGEDETLAKKAAECINSLVAPLMEDLRAAIEKGRVRKVDEEMCAYLLLGINETFGYRLLIDPDYSIEEGFAVIEDFVTHALTNYDGINAQGLLPAEIIDTGDNLIILDQVSFDEKNVVAGSYLEGELQVRLTDISYLEMKSLEEGFFADIVLKDENRVRLGIDRNSKIAGGASFGHFIITAEKVRKVRFKSN